MKQSLLFTGWLLCAAICSQAQTRTWYADSDADGFGDPTTIITQIPKPSGYVLNYLDCNDTLFNAPAWHPERSAGFTGGAAQQIALAMDTSSAPYVVYRDLVNGEKATVLKFTGPGWVTVGGVGLSAGKISYPDIAIDRSSNIPYVAYSDKDSSDKVTVMKYNGSVWVPVGNRGFSAGRAEYISLAISASGIPYVAYRDVLNNGKVTVMNFVGGNWISLGSAGFSDYSAYYTELALDRLDVPYVVFQDAGYSSAATVMKYDAGSWAVVGNPGFSAGAALYTTLTLDDNSMPYVAFQDQGNGSAATVMRYNGTGWVTVGSAGFSAGQADYTSIALAEDGVPYVAYRDIASSNKATVMRYDGGNWATYGTPGFSAGGVEYTRIAIDKLGVPHVVYTDVASNNRATLMTVGPLLQVPAVTISTLSTTICSGAQVDFQASSAHGGTLPRYLWRVNGVLKDSGDTYTTSALQQGDIVSCALISNASCLLKDSVVSNMLNITVLPAPKVNLGRDTTLCKGDTLLLNAGAYAAYWWSTGDNTPTIKAADVGMFFVTVADNAGCLGSDTIAVIVNDPPVISLPGDTTICTGVGVLLDAGAGYRHYAWSTLDTTQRLLAKSSGNYKVTVKDDAGCAASDSLALTVTPPPPVGLAPDMALCDGSVLLLDAGPGFDTYIWSTADSTQTTEIDAPGTYYVTATDTAGCESMDSVVVTAAPLPVIYLGKDTLICEGTSLVLDGGAGMSSYAWSTGATSRTITVTNAGTYAVEVQDQNGCKGGDDINISTVSCNTGIDDPEAARIRLYPNPASNVLQLTFDQPGRYMVTVLTPEGHMVQELEVNGDAASAQISTLSPGIYLVRIVSDSRTVLKRFIKQ